MAAKDAGSVTIVFHGDNREITLEPESTNRIMDLLDELRVPLDGVLVFNGDAPVPLDALVRDFGLLKIVRVASGG